MNDYNSALIDARMYLQKNDPLDKYWLINEAFILWYTLIENIECENFEEDEKQNMLWNNFWIYKQHYLNDGAYSFILGWMMNVSPWFFDSSLDEDFAMSLLLKAYKSSVNNVLFKWAVRDELNLTKDEIENLKIDMLSRFNFFFNYGKVIEEYFDDVINGT